MGANHVIRAVGAGWEPVTEGLRWSSLAYPRLVCLFAKRLFWWTRSSTREQSWKPAEILLLPHQRKVPQRHTGPARAESGEAEWLDEGFENSRTEWRSCGELARCRAVRARHPKGSTG